MISGSSSTIRTRLDTLAVYLTKSRAKHSLVTSRSSRAPPSRRRESAARLGRLRRRASGGLPAGPASLRRRGRVREDRRPRDPGRALHPQRDVRAAGAGQRGPPPRGRGGVLRPRGQGEGLLRGRRRPPRGDSARTLGLRLRTRRRRPRLREHRARGRLDPGDARARPPRPHVLRRSRAAGEARRAPRGDARVTVGVSVKRKEDARLLVGAGRYLDDLTAPGLLHLAVVRSPHPHARVLAVDRRAALAGAGTVAVLTVDDLPELAGSIPPLVPTPTIRSYAHAVLAGPVVRHAGEAVVVVVAEDRYRAADAAERVRVEEAGLPAPTTPASARARGAPP